MPVRAFARAVAAWSNPCSEETLDARRERCSSDADVSSSTDRRINPGVGCGPRVHLRHGLAESFLQGREIHDYETTRASRLDLARCDRSLGTARVIGATGIFFDYELERLIDLVA